MSENPIYWEVTAGEEWSLSTYKKFLNIDEKTVGNSYLRELDTNELYAYPLLSLGYEHLENGRLNEAIGIFDQALKFNSSFPEIYLNRAVAKMHLKEYADASIDLRKVLELDPSSSLAYANIAVIELENNKLESALDNIKKALEINPGHSGYEALRNDIILRLRNIENR